MQDTTITIDLRTEKEKARELYGYESMNEAIRAGKRSYYAKAVGGFSLFKLSNGNYQWCPNGHPPMLGGERDNARIVAKFYWNGRSWKQVA